MIRYGSSAVARCWAPAAVSASRANAPDGTALARIDLAFPTGVFRPGDRAALRLQLGLPAGDVLVMFSDGVPEATDSAGQEYGEDRLATILRGNVHSPAHEMVEAVTADVSNFVAGAPAADDLTLVAIRKTSG